MYGQLYKWSFKSGYVSDKAPTGNFVTSKTSIKDVQNLGEWRISDKTIQMTTHEDQESCLILFKISKFNLLKTTSACHFLKPFNNHKTISQQEKINSYSEYSLLICLFRNQKTFCKQNCLIYLCMNLNQIKSNKTENLCCVNFQLTFHTVEQTSQHISSYIHTYVYQSIIITITMMTLKQLNKHESLLLSFPKYIHL